MIEQVLGEGGMGRVYRARHRHLRRRFAIKVLHGEHAAHDKMVARFQREADAVGRLTHPNVVNIVDFGQSEDGLRFLVMDYVDGVTLRALLRDHSPLPGDRALALIVQICEGLAHAHGRGLVHRDLKPDNILVETGADGELVRIVDFGLAVAWEETAGDQRLTTEGLVLGTPHYMAPEQSTGQAMDHRVDLYALGVILYEMVAGTSPFQGPPAVVAQLHAYVEPPEIAQRVPGLAVDPLIEALAMRLMAKQREDRPSSAREVADLVRAIETDRTAAMAALKMASPPETAWPTEAVPKSAPRTTVTVRRRIASAPAPLLPSLARRSSTIQLRPPQRSRRLVIATALCAVLLIAANLRMSRPDPGGSETSPQPKEGTGSARRAKTVAAEPPKPSQASKRVDVPSVTNVPQEAAAPAPSGPETPVDRPPRRAPPTATATGGGTGDRRRSKRPGPRAARKAARTTITPQMTLPWPRDAALPPAGPAGLQTAAPPDAAHKGRPTPPAPIDPRSRDAPQGASASLAKQYSLIGEKLDQLIARRGEKATIQLKERYLAIPLADALRNPALAEEVVRRLVALRNEIDQALR